MSRTEVCTEDAPKLGRTEVSPRARAPSYARGNNFGASVRSAPKRTEDGGCADAPPPLRCGANGAWPHGTGGRCGEVFAATLARRQADIARLGLRAATELWIAEGLQGSAIMAVLTDADWARMERAS